MKPAEGVEVPRTLKDTQDKLLVLDGMGRLDIHRLAGGPERRSIAGHSHRRNFVVVGEALLVAQPMEALTSVNEAAAAACVAVLPTLALEAQKGVPQV